MGRDSNPRRACTLNGFQDRRNRPLCHPSETLYQNILSYFFKNAIVIFHLLQSVLTCLRFSEIVKIIAPATNIADDNN